MNRISWFAGVGVCLFSFAAAAADDPAKPSPPTAAQQELFKNLETALSGSTLVGQFTITGQEPGKLHEERYVISKATKLPEGDYWLLTARIKYGDKDVTLPVPLEVKWAGKTPVLTLDKVSLPGLGTFNARVVIDGKLYAGTWTHDAVGGHLFGRIEPGPAREKK